MCSIICIILTQTIVTRIPVVYIMYSTYTCYSNEGDSGLYNVFYLNSLQ